MPYQLCPYRVRTLPAILVAAATAATTTAAAATAATATAVVERLSEARVLVVLVCNGCV